MGSGKVREPGIEHGNIHEIYIYAHIKKYNSVIKSMEAFSKFFF